MTGSDKKRPLGKILLKQKLVTPTELESLLEKQRSNPAQRLASHARAGGSIPDVSLLKALSEQHGVPGMDLSRVVIPTENLRLIPIEIARRHLVLPVVVREDRIFLAMADPLDRRIVDEIEFVTGRRVFQYVALHEPLSEVIEAAYRSLERGEAHYVGSRAAQEQQASPSQDAGRRSDPVPNDGSIVVDREFEDELGIDDGSTDGFDLAFDSSIQAAPRGDPDKCTILVVDDEQDIRRLLRRILTDKGFEVLEASSGFEALRAVRAYMPNVILLDAMLPEVHGFDICRRIKGSKRYGNIPVIMVSAVYRGWRFAEDLKQSYGVDVFLEKPFKIGDVVAAVQAALEGNAYAKSAEDDDLSRKAAAALEQGIDAYQNGDIETAIAELERGVKIDPLSFRLHYHLGLLYGRKDALFEAINELETAVDLQSKHFSALKNLAVLYQRAGFKHKAVEMWERALGNAPDDEIRKSIKQHLVDLL